MEIKERQTCRICDGALKIVLDLGELYPSNFIESDRELNKAPLRLAQCEKCNLVQLKDTVELDSMYRQYWYRSSLNPSMVRDLKDIVENIEKRIELKDNEVVIDIGCNDGTMLSMFSNRNLYTIGYDPALNLASEASKNCIKFVNDYFPSKELQLSGMAKVITSIAMFYDLEDPKDFVSKIKEALAEDGIWVVQFTDLLSMLKAIAFDNICHEHLEYYSLRDLTSLFNQFNLTVFDVEYNKVNGGSLRVYVCHSGAKAINVEVYNALRREKEYLESFEDPIAYFADKTQLIKNTINYTINEFKSKGKRVAMLGASTKGNTLLQYFGLDSNMIEHAAEVNKDKFGLKTVGTNIPIIPQEGSLATKPDFYFLPIWHFAENIVSRNEEYLDRGGKFILPMPEPMIIEKKKGKEVTWKKLPLHKEPSPN